MRRTLMMGALLAALGAVLVGSCAREPLGRTRQPSDPAGPHDRLTGSGCSRDELSARPREVSSGLASYYHDDLAGNPTASGEPYDPNRLSAAHRTLPFGTRLRIVRTDLASSPVSCVTVNDRGPHAGRRRIVDLSRRAAEHLDMIRAGVVPVRVDVL